MNEILFALMLVAKSPAMPDQQLAVFSTRAQCSQEAENLVRQGPKAYCVPVNPPPNTEASLLKMTALMRVMMQEMKAMDNVR
jgi:hypothetical protein